MPSTVTKDWISRELPKKGEFFLLSWSLKTQFTDMNNSFGWVNASYIYGLQIVNAHMRRALGTLTPYETFMKALEDNHNKALQELS